MSKESLLNESCHKSFNLCNGNGSGGQNCNDKSTLLTTIDFNY